MKISKRRAAKIRLAIHTARDHGWRRPPRMLIQPMRYQDALYGAAWQHEMERQGNYPPRFAPRG